MFEIDLPKNFLCLLAVVGLGVVLAGSGFQGMTSNPAIAYAGVAIIFGDMVLWLKQKQHRN